VLVKRGNPYIQFILGDDERRGDDEVTYPGLLATPSAIILAAT